MNIRVAKKIQKNSQKEQPLKYNKAQIRKAENLLKRYAKNKKETANA